MMKVDFPQGTEVLFDPEPRYICLWGGRGSGKSWSVARALLLRAVQEPLRILCGRELMNSIAESVHKLLSLQIVELGLEDFFTVQNTSIVGQNGSEFIFTGLKNNAGKLKSYESINIAWLEEAQAVTKASWEILTPTIRAPKSQIICTFNPVLEDDFIYQFFIKHPPVNAEVVRVNYTENPWFGDPLLTEMRQMKERDPDAYLNVWEGHPRQTLDGAIYAKELRAAQEEGRICRVPYDPTKPVNLFWDLGWADNTSIWFAQTVGFETRVVDFYQNHQQPLQHYLQAVQDRGYVLGTFWLPHDARAKQLGTGRSIEEVMRASGRNVRIVPSLSVEDGINAARTAFGNCYFDADKTSDGLQCLRRYRYDVDAATGQFSRKPLHDDASHGADAFRYLSVALKEPAKQMPKAPPVPRFVGAGATAWMGS